jgi:hypothetical protein
MLGFFWVTLTNTCPDSENVCLIVEYFSFQQHEYAPTHGMKQTTEWEAVLRLSVTSGQDEFLLITPTLTQWDLELPTPWTSARETTKYAA